MTIRFKLSQTEMFRRGVNAPEGIVTLDVDPATLSEDERELIFRHLFETDDGINVVYDPKHANWEYAWPVPVGGHPAFELVEASGSNLSELLETLRQLESHVNQTIQAGSAFSQPAPGKRPGAN
jgi:hypothetical protein